MALAAHVLGGGCVQPIGVLLVAVVVAASSWTQLARQRSLRFTMAWLAATQGLAHGLLTYTCQDGSAGPVKELVPSTEVLVLHAFVVALCALACHRVDRWLCRVADLGRVLRDGARKAVAGLLAAVAPLPDRRAVPCPLLLSAAVAAPVPTLWAGPAPVRRGPPRAPGRQL
jgi:hypothetical protein